MQCLISLYWHKTVFHRVVTEVLYLYFILRAEQNCSISHSPACHLSSNTEFSIGHYCKLSKFYPRGSTSLSCVGEEELLFVDICVKLMLSSVPVLSLLFLLQRNVLAMISSSKKFQLLNISWLKFRNHPMFVCSDTRRLPLILSRCIIYMHSKCKGTKKMKQI